MKTYLSIDLDFFNNNKDHNYSRHILDLTLSRAQKFKIPVIAVMNHQQLLPQVDRHFKDNNCRLINVDWHSDICQTKDLSELNCGTWISYVKKRKLCEFLWLHPAHDNGYKVEMGCCHDYKKWNTETDWRIVSGRSFRPKDVPGLVKKDVCEMGLCMSPGWSNDSLMKIFRELLKKYEIPYRKGKINEISNVVHRKLNKGY
jgi:hypothetical protein